NLHTGQPSPIRETDTPRIEATLHGPRSEVHAMQYGTPRVKNNRTDSCATALRRRSNICLYSTAYATATKINSAHLLGAIGRIASTPGADGRTTARFLR